MFFLGLTCIQKRERGEECICVLQLTEAGDIFYQILEPQQPETEMTRPSVPEEESAPQQGVGTQQETALKEATTSGTESLRQLLGQETFPKSQHEDLVSDTTSDEEVIGPTLGLTTQTFVAETPEREWRSLDDPENVTCMSRDVFSESSSEESDESDRKKRLWKHLGLQVLVNDEPVLGQTSELVAVSDVNMVNKNNNDDITKEPYAEETMNSSISLSRVNASEPQNVVRLSTDTLIMWKLWLQKLMPKSRKNKARPHHLQQFTTKTKDVLGPPDSENKNPTDEELVCRLRQDLRACMRNRSLLVQGSASSLEPLEMVPFPDSVNTEEWTDPLSQRLTASWQGEDSWRAWWEDQLGLNREAKVKELRRKRRREKATKRAAGRGLELSESFTSSVSHQLDLDDFSDSTGWSSAASQGAWSDSEGTGMSQLDGLFERQTQRATTPSTMRVITPSATPLKEKEQHGEHIQSSPSSSLLPPVSQTPKRSSTSATQRRTRRPLEYLSTLFAQVASVLSFCILKGQFTVGVILIFVI